jgi:hypothetical protein
MLLLKTLLFAFTFILTWSHSKKIETKFCKAFISIVSQIVPSLFLCGSFPRDNLMPLHFLALIDVPGMLYSEFYTQML